MPALRLSAMEKPIMCVYYATEFRWVMPVLLLYHGGRDFTW